jgi:ferrochelatase
LRVICPAFVSDCLETLEEIGIRGRNSFLAAGGADFALIPCLNGHPAWIGTLRNMVAEFAEPAGARSAACQARGPHSIIRA